MNVVLNNVLVMVVSALVSAFATSLPAAENDGENYNVLFISIDDLNDWTGGLGGHPNAKTPNIDKLGTDGILFTNAHAQAPICGPSRASFMTGLQPTTTGIYLHIRDEDVRGANENTRSIKFLPEYFEEHGYKTMGTGKLWHGDDLANTFQAYGRHLPEGEWFGPRPKERIHYDYTEGPHYDGESGTATDWGAFPDRDEEMPDHFYASWTIERLQEEHDEPFFLGVGFVRPHVPWYVPEHWMEKHPLEEIELPPYKEDEESDVPEIGRRMTFMPPMPTREYLKEEKQWTKMLQSYLASTTFVDYQVGRVLQALEESRYADNTIVVLFSDHGYHLGEKNRVAKMSLWERDTRVPLIFAGPGIDSGLRSGRPVGLIDMYPTLLDLCNLPENSQNEGRSLTPLMEDVQREWPYPAMTSFGPNNIALRTDDFRYIRYEDGSEEFYDHRSDPHERHNLAKDPGHRPRFEAKIEKLQRFIPKDPAPLAYASSFMMNPYFRDRSVRWRE